MLIISPGSYILNKLTKLPKFISDYMYYISASFEEDLLNNDKGVLEYMLLYIELQTKNLIKQLPNLI